MTSQPARKLGLQPFDRALIQDYLERSAMPFNTDNDGDFAVTLRLTPENAGDAGLDLGVFLMATGENSEIFTIRGTGQAPVPEEMWGHIALACNQWNGQTLLTKAYLISHEATNDQPALGRLIVDLSVPLDPGVSQLQLDEFIQQGLNGIVSFWTWLAAEGVIQFSDPNAQPGADETDPIDPSLN